MSAIVSKAVDKLLDSYPVIEEVSPDFGEGGGEALAPPPHIHQWRIAEPEGAESLGICWTCREYRMFKNFDSSHDFRTSLEEVMGC